MVDAIAVNSANRSRRLRPPHGTGVSGGEAAGGSLRVLPGEYSAGVRGAGKCLRGGDAGLGGRREPEGVTYSTGPGALGRLGSACYRHRWVTVLVWIAGVASLITLWTRFGAAAQNDFTGSDPGQTLLNQHFARQSGDTLTLAIESRQAITDPAVKTRVAQAAGAVRERAARHRGGGPVHDAGSAGAERAHRLRHRPVRRVRREHQLRRGDRADARRDRGERARQRSGVQPGR